MDKKPTQKEGMIMIMKRFTNDERGMAAFIAIMIMLMMSIIGVAVVKLASDEVNIAGNELNEMGSFYAAEAGLERACADIQHQYEATGFPPSTMPSGSETVNQCAVTYATTDNGAATMETLTSGALAGLHGLVKTFTVTSSAVSSIDQSKIELTQEFEAALVPIFQFAVFYTNDLYATPAAAMSVSGRVHVNGDMYLQANVSLSFDGKVTAAGGIYHGFPSWLGVTEYTNDVNFKNSAGTYLSMKSGSKWIDASKSYWLDSATARWTGNVKDHAFGIEDLNLPLTNSSNDPHKIIERASGNPDSYEEKASIKIIDGVVYQKVGSVWQDITSLLPSGTVSTVNFYDDREDKTVVSTDIDISKLNTSGYFPSNGLLYASDQRGSTYNVLRLKNGTELDTSLTVFSENPAYIWGNYNTTNKKPAAIVADAVTYLSNSWSDANSNKSLRTYRTVSSTMTVNVSMITGDRAPTSTSYGGGLANLPRFLEHWNSRQFTYRGSMVQLWRSVQATGLWKYGTSDEYYTAPTRDYGFDTDLNDPSKLPPFTPQVQNFQRLGWKQQFVTVE
jgi:Tfp pilus assembly protein PilX